MTPSLHRRTSIRWWRLAPPLALGTVAVAILATRWRGIEGSHPAYLVTLIAVVVAAVAVGASALFWRGANTAEVAPQGTGRTWVGRAAGVIAVIGLIAVLAYLRPLPASQLALDATTDGVDLTVEETRSTIVLSPTGQERQTGIVFFPGALVDPRAYVPNLAALAVEGHRVVIIKAPYNIALLARGAAIDAMDANPAVTRWVVGGHSLGGVAASSIAGGGDDRVRGLLLWASFPNSSIANQEQLVVTSISASRDALATPAKIQASAIDLPPATEFVEVEGANHSFFGDYGTQAGDGTPTISRADAQLQIRQRSLALMQRIDRSG